MDLPHGAWPLTEDQSHLRAYSFRIPWRAIQTHAEARLRLCVVIEFCLCTVLRHHQVHPPVSIVITKRRAARFAVNPDAGLLSWHRRQFSGAVATEPQPAPGVESRCFRLCREKVLAEKNVFVSVTIHVGHTHGEYRRKLRFGRQCHSFKMVSAV